MSSSESLHEKDVKDGIGFAHVDEAQTPRTAQEALDDDPEFTYAEQRKIIHRIDRRLIVTTGIMYCISLMDRTNLSAAAIAGMRTELGMVNNARYSIIALVFFITYVIFQPPMTIMCRKVGPRPFLSFITFAWGVVMIGFGFPTSWVGLVPLRLLLGILEAGFFPGCVYLISTWFSRYDLQKRYAVFYLIGCLASAFSGILAYGLMQMDGVNNFRGWRWIFIWEGILTCFVGIGGYFLLVDFPDRAAKKHKHFLTEKECNFIIRRISKDRGDAEVEKFNLAKWAASGKDLKIWGFALIFMSITTGSYAIAYFLPIILNTNLGFSIGASQCLIAPPYAFAGIVMYGTSYLSDKYRVRGPFLVFNAVLALIGLPIMGFAQSNAARYFGVFLVTAGCNANIPCAMAYQANNIRGQWKRAFCSATLVGFGGIGGIAGSTVFRDQDRPHYRPGIIAVMACNALVIVVVAVNTIYFRRANRKAEREGKVLEGAVDFRYTL